MSEKQDIVLLLQENKEEMDLLAELHSEHKELLDQTKLMDDLERLRAYACLHILLAIQAHRYSVVRSTNITNGSSKPTTASQIEESRR